MSGSRWCKASPSLSGEVTETTWVLPGGPAAVSEEGTGLFFLPHTFLVLSGFYKSYVYIILLIYFSSS